MKPEHIARLRSIAVMLKDIREEIENILANPSEFQESTREDQEPRETHVDERQDEVDTFEAEMPIESLTAGMEGIKLTATVTEIGKVESFKKKDGKEGQVCKIVVNDGTASISIPLWDEQVAMADKLKLLSQADIDAWKVTEYKGKLQLALGKWGSILPMGQEALKDE